MKRSLIVIALLGAMLALPFMLDEKVGTADANIQPSVVTDAPEVLSSTSAKAGQVWTLAGSNVANGFFVVTRVERHNGAMVVHGHVEGLIKNVKTEESHVAEMPFVTLSLGAFNRSVVQLVGTKTLGSECDTEYEVWEMQGAPVSSHTVAQIVGRQFS